MVQIISDKSSDWVNWLAEVISRLENYSDISRMVVFAKANNEENNSRAQIIEFMNCDTDDIYLIGGVLQKEAIKHEIVEELGFEDESWESDEGEEYDNV